MNIEQALEKELALHELPVSIAAFMVVTPYFAYLVDDLDRENAGQQQGRILVNSPQVADMLTDRLAPAVGGLALFQEACEITGILKPTELSAFPRHLYRISELKVMPAAGEPILLDESMDL